MRFLDRLSSSSTFTRDASLAPLRPAKRARRAIAVLLSLSLAPVPGCRHARPIDRAAADTARLPGSDPIGTTLGSPTVGYTGAASYDMGLPVPPGTGGHQPTLSLQYNSQGGDGVLGFGGLLTGFSAVTRCALRRDGISYPVTYGTSDRFCLDGQLLVLASGTYGGNGATYRTERDAFLQITSHGDSCGSGPCSFTVRTPTGQSQTYGGSVGIEAVADGSATIADGSMRVWPIVTWTDRNSNAITYTYQEDQSTGEYVPRSVAYTSNATASPAWSAQRAVTFHYGDRKWPATYYQGGAQVVHSKLLERVETCVSETPITDCDDEGAQRVLTRALKYHTSSFTGRAHLREVHDIGSDGTPMAPTTFEWQKPTSTEFGDPTSWSSSFTSSSGWDVEHQPRLMADLDGDGRTDLVGFAGDVHFSLSTGSSFGEYQAAHSSLASCSSDHDCLFDYPRATGDVDGDGRADAIAFENDHVYALRFDGTNFAAPAPWSDALTFGKGWDDSIDQRTAADLDGDGRTDIIGFGQQSTQFYYSNGEAFVARSSSSTTDFSAADGFSISSGNPPMLVDVDGDGASDIVGFLGQSEIWVGLANGNGFDARAQWSDALVADPPGSWSPSEAPRRLADVNGDGLADVVGFRSHDVVVAFSTGTSFTDPVVWSNSTFAGWDDSQGSQRVLADVNGDGRADIVGFASEGVKFGISRGTTFENDVVTVPSGDFAYGPLPNNPRFPMATTGDAIAALVVFGDSHVLVSAPPSDTAELVTAITNGLGGGTHWTYSSLSSPDADQWYTSAAAVPDLPQYREYLAPINVVTRVVHRDGRGDAYVYDQRWAGSIARIDQTGFLGFQSHTEIDRQINPDASEPGQSATTAFQHTFLDGQGQPQLDTVVPVGETIARTSDGFVLHRSSSAVEATATVGEAWFVHPNDEEVRSYSTASKGEVTTRKTFSFDAWGNHRLIHDEGDVDDPDDDRDTCVTYQVDTTAWTLAFPVTVDQTHGACTLSSDGCSCPTETGSRHAQVIYTDDGRLNPHRVRAYDDQHDAWLGTELTYDTFGQRLRRTVKTWDGGSDEGTALTWTERSYDPTYQTFPTQLTNEVYQTQATFDPGHGRVLTTTDPNGVTLTNTLDGFGRVVDTHGPGSSGSGSVLLSHSRWGRNRTGWFRESRTLADWSGGQKVTRQYFDGLGRTFRSTLATSDDATLVRELVYSSPSQLAKHGLPRFSDGASQWVVHEYDSVGRPKRIDFPTGDAVEMSYDIVTVDGIAREAATSTLLTAKDTTARQVTSYSNAQGQIVRRDFPGIDERPSPSVRMAWDAFGRMQTLSAPDGTSTTITYDSLDRRKLSTSTVRGTTTWTWASNASQVTVRSATGDTVSHHLDPLMREAQRVLTSADGSVRTMSFTYDDATSGRFGLGRLARVDDTGGGGISTTYGYDAYGNLAATARSLDGHDFPWTSAYGPTGQRVSTTFPSGAAARWQYGVTGVLQSLSYCETASACAANDYDAIGTWSDFTAMGRPQTVTLGASALTEARTYDALGRPRTTTASTSSGPVLDETTTWASLLDVESVDDAIDDDYDRSFTYFDTGYVHTATVGSRSFTLDYDDGGSLTTLSSSAGETDFTVDGQKISKITAPEGSVSAGYLADGSLRWVGSAEGAKDTWTFDYDPAGTLVSARGPSTGGSVVEESYLDDHTGWQLRRQRGDGAIVYAPSPDLQLTVLPSGEEIFTHSLFGSGSLVGTISTSDEGGDAAHEAAAKTRQGATSTSVDGGLQPGPNGAGLPVGGQTLLFSNDLTHGTSLAVDPTSATPVARVTYDPFGEVSEQSTGTDTFFPKFDGYAQSPDSGLLPMGARALSPQLGRFTRPDSHLVGASESSPAAYNAYAFGGNSWASLVDPSGHSAKSILIGIGVVTAITVTAIAAPELLPEEAAVALSLGTGAYMGGSAVNRSYNPAKWKYGSWQTYVGMAGGVAISGAGMALAAGVPAALPEGWSAGARLMAGMTANAAIGAGMNTAFAAMGGARGKQLGSAAVMGAAFGALMYSSFSEDGLRGAIGDYPTGDATEEEQMRLVEYPVPAEAQAGGRDIQRMVGFDNWYAIHDQASGANVWMCGDTTDTYETRGLVDRLRADDSRSIAMLTGTHGDTMGETGGRLAIPHVYDANVAYYGDIADVTPYNVVTMSSADISNVASARTDVVCAWCWSDRSTVTLDFLGMSTPGQ